MGFYIVCILIGVVVGLITVFSMKAQLKSVHKRENAHDYVQANSLVLTRSTERFLYERVSRTSRPKNNNN